MKREGYRAAFAGFDVERSPGSPMPTSTGWCRTRRSSATGARSSRRSTTRARSRACSESTGRFDAYVWSFVDGTPIVGYVAARSTSCRRSTEESTALEQGPEAARLPLRRADDDVRVHAGGRVRRRPRRRRASGTTGRRDARGRHRRHGAARSCVITPWSCSWSPSACVGAALVVRHDTDELQAQAVPLDRQRARAWPRAQRRAAPAHPAVPERVRQQGAVGSLTPHQAQVDASNHAVDVANQAVDQYNSGQTPTSPPRSRARATPRIADLEARTPLCEACRAAAQRADRRGCRVRPVADAASLRRRGMACGVGRARPRARRGGVPRPERAGARRRRATTSPTRAATSRRRARNQLMRRADAHGAHSARSNRSATSSPRSTRRWSRWPTRPAGSRNRPGRGPGRSRRRRHRVQRGGRPAAALDPQHDSDRRPAPATGEHGHRRARSCSTEVSAEQSGDARRLDVFLDAQPVDERREPGGRELGEVEQHDGAVRRAFITLVMNAGLPLVPLASSVHMAIE